MKSKFIKRALVTAGMMNFSVIIFSKGFSNKTINEADPIVMSNFGLLMIVIWGLAYIASANLGQRAKWLAAIFAVEKFVYGLNWLKWLSMNNLNSLYEKDFLAGIFYSIYGINDIIFMFFFIFISYLGFQKKV